MDVALLIETFYLLPKVIQKIAVDKNLYFKFYSIKIADYWNKRISQSINNN